MLARFVRQCFGWEVWSTIERDDPVRMDRVWDPWRMFQDGYLVGQWTGPRRELLCVVRCDSLDDATWCLAPRAPTVTLATLASLLLRVENERRRRAQRAKKVRASAPAIGGVARVDVPRAAPAIIVEDRTAALAEVLPIVKRRYARELALVSEQLGLAPLE